MQTRDQKLAATIYTHVSELTPKSSDAKQYGAMAHKLPILIHTAGLAQALTFVEARGVGKQKLLLKHLAIILGDTTAEKLLQRCYRAELGEYQMLTMRAVAALQWYKRFAQSILEVEAGEESTTEG